MSQSRQSLPLDETWDLSTIFPSDDLWEKEAVALESLIETAKSYQGHVLDDAKSLLDITEYQLELSRRLEKLYAYAHMKNDQDTREACYQEMESKGARLYSLLGEAFAFYEPELLTVSSDQLASMMQEEPKLVRYRYYFDHLLKQKDHVLSQEQEALLAGAGEIFEAASHTYEVLDNADLLFPQVMDDNRESVQLSHGNFITLMESRNRQVRQSAYEVLYGVYQQYQHTYAQTLQTTVKTHNYLAKVRYYDSARQAALAPNTIPEAVYETLLSAVRKHLSLLHRYVDLKARVLGLDEIQMLDMYVPLSHLDMSMTYDNAKQKAREVLRILGPDYADKVDRAFDDRWIDVRPNPGKRSGAYSGGSYDTNAFMLLNWQDTLDNLFTLVHETGHSIHSVYSRTHQPYVYGDYTLFLAEIASTTNENILTETLLKEATSDQERFTILNHFLDGFRGTVFRQTQFAEFEWLIHEADAKGEVLTSEYLNQLYAKLNEEYYGLSAKNNPEIQFEWARIPHFYYNFYVYQYATGFAAATYLAERIVHGTKKEKEAYLEFLKAGSSADSLDIMKRAGVDMLNETYLSQAFDVFERRLDELEALVDKGVGLTDK